MTEFNRQTLGEICDVGGGEIKTGPFGTQLHHSDYVSDGIPVVMPKNIVAGKVSLDDIAQIGEDDANRLKQHRLNRGDIVFGRRGDIGIHALIGQREAGWLCGTGCLRITLGVGPIDPHFLHYYLDQQQVIRWIYNQAIGATMPNLNTSILRSVPIEYPPVPIQRKISGILSAYDDLIENNLRRIKILEEMAQSLYREWFVKFRFPGHEKVRMVDSPLGKIPEGWDCGMLSDALILQRGFDLPTNQRKAGQIPVYAATGQVGFHDNPKVKEPCVVTGRSGSLGTVLYVDEAFWPLNTTLWVKEFRRVRPLFAFYLLEGLNLAQFNSGAAVPTLNRNDVHALPVVLPDRQVLNLFGNYSPRITRITRMPRIVSFISPPITFS